MCTRSRVANDVDVEIEWPAAPQPTPDVDYRALLKAYMATVLECEGITFVQSFPTSKQPPHIVAALKEIEAEVIAEDNS